MFWKLEYLSIWFNAWVLTHPKVLVLPDLYDCLNLLIQKKLTEYMPFYINWLDEIPSLATIWKFNPWFDTQLHGVSFLPTSCNSIPMGKNISGRTAGESIGSVIHMVKCSFSRAGVKKYCFNLKC